MSPCKIHKDRCLFVIIAAIIIFGLVLAAGPAYSANGLVRVNAQVWVSGTDVFLADIALISGLGELSQKVNQTLVAKAPAPGKQKTIRSAWIRAKIDKLGLPAGTVIEIPPMVRVHRLCQSVDKKRFKQLFAGYLQENLCSENFEISRFQINGNGPVPEGRLEVVIFRPARAMLYGQVRAFASVSVDGATMRRVTLSAWVDYFSLVVCAKRKLDRLAVLGADDIMLETRNIARLAQGVLTDPEQAVGLRLRQKIPQGKELCARILEKAPVINKGDDVTIVARANGIIVTTLGLAKKSGGLGDHISVENLMSKKLLTCRVLSSSMVEVWTAL